MQHQNPIVVDDVHCPPGVPPLSGFRWFGHRRIVHKQRARKLRKRGVQLQAVGPGTWAWYETPWSYELRSMVRNLKRTRRLQRKWFFIAQKEFERKLYIKS